jgi:DNA-binding response OmpR family regulator
MRILTLAKDNPDLATVESALRLEKSEVSRTEGARAPESLRLSRWRFDGWMLDGVTRRCVDPEGRDVDLTSSEYDLLTAFLREPGRALSRSTLLRDLRGRSWTYFDRSIDTLVARLRKKIDLDPARPLIRSVRYVGYVFCATVCGAPVGDQ